MAEKESDPNVLSGEEALALARKDADTWNDWAGKHEGHGVDFSKVDFTTGKNRAISFTGFTFPGSVNFHSAKFLHARFDGATFKEEARFDEATFKKDACFDGATFEGGARFNEVAFEGDAWFNGAIFEGFARFGGATFKRGIKFDETVLKGEAWFREAKIRGDAKFDRSVFMEDAGFQATVFNGFAGFLGARFEKHLGLPEPRRGGEVAWRFRGHFHEIQHPLCRSRAKVQALGPRGHRSPRRR